MKTVVAIFLLVLLSGCSSESREVGRLRKAARKGDLAAQVEMGLRCSEGRGVSRNEQDAFFWFYTAARNDYAPACYAVAICYIKGRGVKKDIEKGMEWMVRAAAFGDGNAEDFIREYRRQM